MGREIRKVPPNWEHPYRDSSKPPYRPGKENGYQPMFNQTFESAAAEWKAEFAEWERGERLGWNASDYPTDYQFWEWHGAPPEREYYRPWKDEDATWFQIWETVSEGTPVSPPFATKSELVEYLVANGDFWDQQRGDGGWSRSVAEQFVETGFAMSGIIAGGKFYAPRDGQPVA